MKAASLAATACRRIRDRDRSRRTKSWRSSRHASHRNCRSKANSRRSAERSAGSIRSRSPPADLRGKVVLVDFWTYSCINWLRTEPYVRALGREVQGPGPGRDRRPHAGVRLREERRQHPMGGEELPGRLPDRDRQRLRRLARLRQPLLAGALFHRCRRPHPPSPVRRGRLRDIPRRSSRSCSPRPE